uniref:Cytosolic carboxypeptidase 6-like n=2 Tax=Stegastes partitus TaxID=144197 RepID=A0A3B5BFJ7_9TELE
MEENPARDVETGSEAGGEDALVGNVNKLVVSPPGYSGPPRKGHLVFDACFESGNLGRVDYISEFEFDLFIRPDTCNPRFRVWFNFTVENVRETQVSMLRSGVALLVIMSYINKHRLRLRSPCLLTHSPPFNRQKTSAHSEE